MKTIRLFFLKPMWLVSSYLLCGHGRIATTFCHMSLAAMLLTGFFFMNDQARIDRATGVVHVVNIDDARLALMREHLSR